MTTRRRDLPWIFAALFVAAMPAATAAAAEEATIRGEAPGAAPPRPPAKPRGAARRRNRPRNPADDAARGEAVPPSPETGPRLEAAPVPNRDLEGPRAPGGTDRTRLTPSVITRNLPTQGMAAEGAPNIQEERLFFPAPGARLNVPFSY